MLQVHKAVAEELGEGHPGLRVPLQEPQQEVPAVRRHPGPRGELERGGERERNDNGERVKEGGERMEGERGRGVWARRTFKLDLNAFSQNMSLLLWEHTVEVMEDDLQTNH